MDLVQLEIFKAVAEHGSISAAAQQIHRVPSNLTTRIKQLEQDLGVDLFIREKSRLRLSPAGWSFLEYARRILDLVQEARATVAGEEPQGAFPLGSLESTAAVRIPALLAAHGVAVVPVSGRTGLVGGAMTTGGLMLSVERLNRIRDIRPDARIAIVEAGVILSRLHDAATEHGLYFPLWFGARGSAMIGGVLSTNAGGSNVLRYGSTRALCLGLEVVLADGRVLNLMSELHKDNSGYDLKQLFIGAEGTLGLITAATLKLFPQVQRATAWVICASADDVVKLLAFVRGRVGDTVTSFEIIPGNAVDMVVADIPTARDPMPSNAPCCRRASHSVTSRSTTSSRRACASSRAWKK